MEKDHTERGVDRGSATHPLLDGALQGTRLRRHVLHPRAWMNFSYSS
jgi:hypothetical protein